MDSHDRCDRLLTAFLAGDLDSAEARQWDEHLLECERCWRAVREDRAGRRAAQVLGCPRGTVLARVHRGRRRLAQALAEAGVSHGQP